MNKINERIEKEYCDKTSNKLKDENLLKYYEKCKSVKNKTILLNTILENNNVKSKDRNNIINDFMIHLIPPGTKGVIRGNMFNTIIKKLIENINLDNNRFEICFEKKCYKYITDEIPDWYILDLTTNKILIGMNQIDLWSGGQQINRGYNYLFDNKYNNEKCKLLCVICKNIKFNKINKTYKLFEKGFKDNTLCYIKNLHNIIFEYFDK